jgi:hypothetical protein
MQITTNVVMNEQNPICCDLHLGDSRLQYLKRTSAGKSCCDLHLGDSRLQFTLSKML